jgi:hypothetical protein
MPTLATHLWKPSDSRVVVIDSFIPVPRGASVSVPAPLNWASKDPRDVLDYQVDIGPALVGDDGDSIETMDISVTPNAAGDLAVLSSAADGTRVVVWLAGGQSGTVYTVTIEVSTTNGRTLLRSILLPVVSLANPDSPDNSLEIVDGVSLVDSNGNPILAVP